VCQFNFCLHSDSFSENGHSLDSIYRSIESIANLKEKIILYEENFFKDDSIYNIRLYGKKEIWKILYPQDFEEILDADYKKMLALIIDRAKEHSDEHINKYIGLNRMSDQNLIYNVDDWMNYHYEDMKTRHEILDFTLCIRKYFSNLVFQENIESSMRTLMGGLSLFANDIINSLICLEKELANCIDESQNLPEALSKFTSILGIETTLEGSASRKAALTFMFKNDNDENENIYCEPHIKLSHSSSAGDGQYYYNRIYFHQGKNSIKHGNILIGHIGKHL